MTLLSRSLRSSVLVLLFAPACFGQSQPKGPSKSEQVKKALSELSSSDAETRVEAVFKLGGLWKEAGSAIPALFQAFKDPDERVRAAPATLAPVFARK